MNIHQPLDTFLADMSGSGETEQQKDVMDYSAAHGFLTGIIIGPVAVDNETVLKYMTTGLSTEVKTEAKAQALASIQALRTEIDRQLNSDADDFCIPDQLVADQSPIDSHLADWCTGFLEAHFEYEEPWLANQEQEILELLLPIMTLSGIFDDEPEFRDITANTDLIEDMCQQLPDILVELYLLFHHGDEKDRKH